MRGAVRQSDASQQIHPALTRLISAAQFQRHHHVFERRQCRDELKALKHKPHMFVAQPRPLIFGELR